ncbi:MAG: restriction endonuclease subunit S [Myxococcota bacterium]|nr:restriction endonuclease subunit S [Myxococcota bacterium]
MNSDAEDLEPLSITKDQGVVLQRLKYKKRIATDPRKYQIGMDGDFAFDPMSLYYGAIGRIQDLGRGLISPDYVTFTVDRSVDHDFLEALLRWSHMHKEYEYLSETSNSRGKRRRLYWSVLIDLPILLPPLPEQKKIAAILSSVDEAIQATQAVIEQTRRVKEGLLQDLLTRGIGHTRFKQTEIGEIPESWEIRRVDQLCQVTSGATPLRSNQAYFDSGDVPWVKTMDLNGGVVSTTDESITPLALAETSCKVLPVGTVMCAMYGGFRQIGRTGVLAMEAATNQAISSMVLKPKAKLLPEFLNYFFVAHRPRWKGIAASSRKDPNITRQDVCGFKVAVPPVAEQHAIVDRVDALTAAIGEGEVALAAHRRVKAGLLQDLLTGKVRVSV